MKVREIVELPEKKDLSKYGWVKEFGWPDGWNAAIDQIADLEVGKEKVLGMVGVDIDKLSAILSKTKREYEALTEFERVAMPIWSAGPRLYAQAIVANLKEILAVKERE